ncbi:MAG: Phosphoadenosine phosphosulfate reductase [Puniceicoccaceae bacterium MED-G32]|jgi:phosphoadenosine phosphosulfate reductase|nr:phosphoadenosine phosphosulfate reductase [Puniceicoccaceae bacterium]RPG15151.1 MAG: phosphoadenylyl-sulfate reductase [Opitutales bacterium TMED207]CAI8267447.1 MAG: Phosphoadenosine phosphosulfate reductase [Puniceicoccaceae bacterium MED-G32]|tara:strand:+ start:2611 stop:3336 length:726 start_codon:yes stop_codon:yes gene_type:complete
MEKISTVESVVSSYPNLEDSTAFARIQWAKNTFGDSLVMSTSFGIQSAVLLHLVTQQIPNIPIIFIDTGYLFPETYSLAEDLTKRLKLNLLTYRANLAPKEQEDRYGKLWEQGEEGLDQYNKINKIEPMNRAITELKASAWLSGLRRQQSQSRKNLSAVQRQNKVTKIYPIIDWDDATIYKYITENNLPYHPLWKKGYVSVGDWHSSSPLKANMTAEETRFNGIKRECGLHLDTGANDFQI